MKIRCGHQSGIVVEAEMLHQRRNKFCGRKAAPYSCVALFQDDVEVMSRVRDQLLLAEPVERMTDRFRACAQSVAGFCGREMTPSGPAEIIDIVAGIGHGHRHTLFCYIMQMALL
ncbi:MAG: hypothetical protein V6Z81_09500 [Parvularculales bacterium]